MIAQLPLRLNSPESALPPCNVEAEMSVIAAILSDPIALERVADKLEVESFYHTGHQKIYSAAISLASSGKMVDMISVCGWLKARNQLEAAGGQIAIANLMQNPIAGINCDFHADIVAEKYLRRQLISRAMAMVSMANDQSLDVRQVLDSSEESLYDLNNKSVDTQAEHIGEACIRVLDANEQGINPGITTTNFLDLDYMTGGWKPGQLVTVAAATAMGKSHFMVAQAVEVAASGHPVVLFSCEMTADELAARLIARMGLLNSGMISRCQVNTPELAERMVKGATKVSTLPIYVFDASNPSLTEMKAALRRVAIAENRPPKLVILDYLQLLGDGSNNRVREIDLLTRGCKCIAKDFNLTFMALAQINRGVEQRQNKRPGLADLRESGSIEQHSNTVVFLYRDEYYDPESESKGMIELIVAKNRGGETGTAKMWFYPEMSDFKSMANGSGNSVMEVQNPPQPVVQKNIAPKPKIAQNFEAGPQEMEEMALDNKEGLSPGDCVIFDLSWLDEDDKTEIVAEYRQRGIPYEKQGVVTRIEVKPPIPGMPMPVTKIIAVFDGKEVSVTSGYLKKI